MWSNKGLQVLWNVWGIWKCYTANIIIVFELKCCWSAFPQYISKHVSRKIKMRFKTPCILHSALAFCYYLHYFCSESSAKSTQTPCANKEHPQEQFIHWILFQCFTYNALICAYFVDYMICNLTVHLKWPTNESVSLSEMISPGFAVRKEI